MTHQTGMPTRDPEEYGPFYHIARHDADAARIVATGELWGRCPDGSDVPQVQAYVGRTPSDRRAVEFMTHVAPRPGTAPWEARWHPDYDGVVLDHDYAKIVIRVVRNTQVTATRGDKRR